jgi:hypothetical protein
LLDRTNPGAVEPEVGILAEFLVKVIADVGGCDFVRGDIRAERHRFV